MFELKFVDIRDTFLFFEVEHFVQFHFFFFVEAVP